MINKKKIEIGAYPDVYVVTNNINHHILMEEVTTFMSETLNNSFYHDFSSDNDRDVIVESLEYFCDILVDNNIIEQYDILFDRRNNSRRDMAAGKFTIETKYKQKNCLNTSSVKFLIGQS